jgi:hypothetical protein
MYTSPNQVDGMVPKQNKTWDVKRETQNEAAFYLRSVYPNPADRL